MTIDRLRVRMEQGGSLSPGDWQVFQELLDIAQAAEQYLPFLPTHGSIKPGYSEQHDKAQDLRKAVCILLATEST